MSGERSVVNKKAKNTIKRQANEIRRGKRSRSSDQERFIVCTVTRDLLTVMYHSYNADKILDSSKTRNKV